MIIEQQKALLSQKEYQKIEPFVVFEDDLNAGSVFSKILPRHSFPLRPEQRNFSVGVEIAIEKNLNVMAEVGVGTGKTLAYLVPAFNLIKAKNQPVLIVTKTIALQKHVVEEVEKLNQLAIFDRRFEVISAKGKEHYLCPVRLVRFLAVNPDLIEAQKLKSWAKESKTHDRLEIPDISDPVWAKVRIDEGTKSCRFCDETSRCRYFQLKRRWAEAEQLIVTNYGLFFSNLLRSGPSRIFPSPGLIIMDEAHALEESAREAYTQTISLSDLENVKGWFDFELDDETFDKVFGLADHIAENLSEFFRSIPRKDDENTRTAFCVPEALRQEMDALASQLQEQSWRLSEKGSGVSSSICKILLPGDSTNWVEQARNDQWSIKVAPKQLAYQLKCDVFDGKIPTILCSGTLAVRPVDRDAPSFEYLATELGLEDAKKIIAESPFDYHANVHLYIADDLPRPSHQNEDGFYDAVPQRIVEIIDCCEGRTLILFTSHRRMDAVFKKLHGFNLHWPLLRETKGNRRAVIEDFRANKASVLLATGMWEGVDFQGPTLSCVIIVKLPFPVPDDPIIKAKQERAEKRHKDAFQNVIMPEMLLKLKQGAGRLIRSETDRGIIAILDGRAWRERDLQAVKKTLWQLEPANKLENFKQFL